MRISKVLFFLVVVVTLFSLAACGDSGSSGTQSSVTQGIVVDPYITEATFLRISMATEFGIRVNNSPARRMKTDCSALLNRLLSAVLW